MNWANNVLVGVSTVYFPKAAGFSIYVTHEAQLGKKAPLSPSFAEDKALGIAWVGIESGEGLRHKTVKGNTVRYVGQSGVNWQKAPPTERLGSGAPLEEGSYIYVDTSPAGFKATPAYITSVQTNHMHWAVSGSGSVYNPAPSGLRVYLKDAKFPHILQLYQWKVNYVAIYGDWPEDCVLSEWSEWSQVIAVEKKNVV